jgi:hypothetical protein
MVAGRWAASVWMGAARTPAVPIAVAVAVGSAAIAATVAALVAVGRTLAASPVVGAYTGA